MRQADYHLLFNIAKIIFIIFAFRTHKKKQKSQGKKMLRFFSRLTHKDSDWRTMFTGLILVVPDPAAYYQKIPEALLFRWICLL